MVVLPRGSAFADATIRMQGSIIIKMIIIRTFFMIFIIASGIYKNNQNYI
jgi:hypothetical protein